MADVSVLARRRSPLSRMGQELTAGSGEAVRLREIPFLAQIWLRVAPGSAGAGALEQALGGSLPAGVGEATALDGDRHLLWLGPDDFLLIAPDEADGGPDPAALAAQLRGALGEHSGQVTDLSANRTTLELSGPRAQEVLDKSVRIDLDPQAFGTGQALVTLLGGVGVILWRTEQHTVRVLPRASFAVHTAQWLLDGMREYV